MTRGREPVNIKPIPTTYQGCRFRSRIEARWAVFFDALDVKWQYEPQGFELDGELYLPDFFLPGWRAWVEIKGAPPSERELDLCRKLWAGRRSARENVFLISGQPWLNEYEVFVAMPDGCAPGFTFAEYGETLFLASDWEDIRLRGPLEEVSGRAAIDGPIIEAAYVRARSARFEHGEKP